MFKKNTIDSLPTNLHYNLLYFSKLLQQLIQIVIVRI